MTVSLGEQFRSAVADVSQMDVATLQRTQMAHIAGLEMSVIPISPAIQLRDKIIMRGAHAEAQYKLLTPCQRRTFVYNHNFAKRWKMLSTQHSAKPHAD